MRLQSGCRNNSGSKVLQSHIYFLKDYLMKKILISLALLAVSLVAGAQVKFGYLSYDNALKSMPDYVLTMANIDNLRQQYDAETKRVEEEFNRKYEDFLEGQNDFAPAILQKRQAELQEMMEKNIAFKEEATRLMEAARNDAFEPLKAKLNGVLRQIGADRGYAFIINTDANACPYIDPVMGEDISAMVEETLRKR